MIGPLADSKADTEGSWMVFGHVPAAVTVLEGLRAKLPAAKIAHAPGPEIRRQVPSMFDQFTPGPKKPPQTPARRREAAFQQAVEAAKGADVVIAVMGELANMSGEAASRASLDLPGRQEELLKAARGARQARRARAPERAPAQRQLGGRERARHPRGVGAGHRGRATRSPTCSSATRTPAASCR